MFVLVSSIEATYYTLMMFLEESYLFGFCMFVNQNMFVNPTFFIISSLHLLIPCSDIILALPVLHPENENSW